MVQTEKLSRPQRVEQAIEHARANHWDAAVKLNRKLLKEQPDDVETANRLGKALTEVDDYEGAAKAYAQALGADPANPIARKNLARLSGLKGKARKRPAATRAASAARAHSLVAESGKSAEFELLEPNSSALKRLSAGDAADLRATDGGVEVATPRGVVLGTIDRRAALRLKRMIEGGNEYVVVIRQITDGEATVHIRESRSDPSLAGQASFIAPAKKVKKRAATRAYTRSSVVVQHEPEALDPDDDEHDTQDSVGTSGSGTEEDEMKERGFTETRSDDDDDADATDDEGDDPDEDDEEE